MVGLWSQMRKCSKISDSSSGNSITLSADSLNGKLHDFSKNGEL